MVEDKYTNENTEANDVRPKRVGIRHFKDYFNSVFHLNQSFRYYKIIYIFENGIAYCSALGNYFVIYIHHKFFFRG